MHSALQRYVLASVLLLSGCLTNSMGPEPTEVWRYPSHGSRLTSDSIYYYQKVERVFENNHLDIGEPARIVRFSDSEYWVEYGDGKTLTVDVKENSVK